MPGGARAGPSRPGPAAPKYAAPKYAAPKYAAGKYAAARLLGALGLALGAGGCATPVFVSPVEVNRFVAAQTEQLGQGTISLVLAPGMQDTLEIAPFLAAAQTQLELLGYRTVATGGAQIAQISLTQSDLEPMDGRGGGRNPVRVGGAAETGSFGTGVGLGLGIDLTPRQAGRIARVLAVAIRPAQGGTNLWEGRAAMTVSVNSDFAAAAPGAERLVAALFRDFPGTSGEVFLVE